MECLAIAAGNGLDGKMPALLRPAGDANAITALGTFEQIGTAHKFQFRCLPSLPQRGSKTKKLRRPIFVEQKKRKVENGLPVFVEIMEGLPSVARNRWRCSEQKSVQSSRLPAKALPECDFR
jgi:hypothetical protein